MFLLRTVRFVNVVVVRVSVFVLVLLLLMLMSVLGLPPLNQLTKFCWGFAFHLQRALSRALLSDTFALALYGHSPSLSLSLTRSQQNSCSAYTKCKQTVKKLSALLCCSRILIENNCNQHQQKQSQGRRRTETSLQGARRGRLNDPASECLRRL